LKVLADVFLEKKRRLFRFMETERLFFRRYKESDKLDLIKLFTDPAVMKHVGEGVLTESQAEEWWQKLFEKLYPLLSFNIWAVFAKADSSYIGHAGIYPRQTKKEDWEIVYFLNQENWGKGYATEIARQIVKFGFEELNLSEVFATVDDDHPTSIRVLEKAGMKFKNYEFDDDGRFSVYSIKAKS